MDKPVLPNEAAAGGAPGLLQRTTLVQLRDALHELGQDIRGVFVARGEALERTGGWDMLSSHHPTIEAVRSMSYRLRLLSTAVEDDALRGKVDP